MSTNMLIFINNLPLQAIDSTLRLRLVRIYNNILIETKSNFAGIFIKKEETLVHLINQGVKASIDLQINSEYVLLYKNLINQMEALRDAYIGMADKKIEK